MKDLIHFLLADKVDSAEFCWLLLCHFTHSEPRDDRMVFRYPEKENYLIVGTSKNDKISSIECSEEFPRDGLKAIRHSIRETLIDNQSMKIGRVIAFSSKPVKGYYRGNGFQILPVSSESPTPEWKIPDYPFLLEVAYFGCSDTMINSSRRRVASLKTSRLLNLLLNARIHMGSNSTESAWVVDSSVPENPTSSWCQLGYYPEDSLADSDDFGTAEGIDCLHQVPFQKYYLEKTVGEELSLPDNLEANVALARGLPSQELKELHLAIYWFSTSIEIWSHSHSASYSSLASSIECLLPKDGDPCKCCGQTVYSVSKRFKDFLEKFAPHDKGAEEAKKLIADFYSTRCGISHGKSLLLSDTDPFALLSPSGERELVRQQTLFWTARVAIYNWLVSQGQLGNPE